MIGNPPYIKEYSNRHAFDGFRETSPYYMGKMDLWYGFACHGIDILASDGILCLIAQNNWTTNTGATKMRTKIINDSQILSLIDFNNYMVFGESASVQTMIMLFRKNRMFNTYSFDYRKLNKINASKKEAMMLLNKLQKEAIYDRPIIIREKLTNSVFTFSSDEKSKILDKMQKSAVFLDKSEVAQGIVFPQDFLNKKSTELLGFGHIGDGVFGLSNEELKGLDLSSKETELIKPYYTSEQVQRYYTQKENTLWMIYTDSKYKDNASMDDYPHIKRHIDKYTKILTSDNKPYGLHRARNPYFFSGEKIICLRKCPVKPVFSYADGEHYVTQTFFVIKTQRIDIKGLTGLLNSKLIEFWLRNRGKMQGENFQIDKGPLLAIPLLNNKSQIACIGKYVDSIIAVKQNNCDANISEFEKEIDQLVYKSYGLSNEEIKLVEGD